MKRIDLIRHMEGTALNYYAKVVTTAFM